MRSSLFFVGALTLCSLMLPGAAHAANCPASANCAGNTCSPLGATQLDADQVVVIACLKTSASNAAPIWKAMVRDPGEIYDLSTLTWFSSGSDERYPYFYEGVAYYNRCPDGWIMMGTNGWYHTYTKPKFACAKLK